MSRMSLHQNAKKPRYTSTRTKLTIPGCRTSRTQRTKRLPPQSSFRSLGHFACTASCRIRSRFCKSQSSVNHSFLQCGYLLKNDIIILAQPNCTASFTASVDSYYTAWNSMQTLTTKKLVSQTGRPMKYSYVFAC